VAWDASRPVPWKKLLWLFGIYAAVAVVVFSLTGGFDAGALGGLVIGGAMYVVLATVLVKFGWDPFTRAQDRADARTAAGSESNAGGAATAVSTPEGPKVRPAPTRRTSTGPATSSPTKKRPAKRR
jgi:hypothetical protein